MVLQGGFIEKDITEDAKKICVGVKELLGPNQQRPSNFTLKHVVDVFRGGYQHCYIVFTWQQLIAVNCRFTIYMSYYSVNVLLSNLLYCLCES